MTAYKERPVASPSATEVASRLNAIQSPEIQDSLKKLQQRYGKHAVPTDEVPEMMDRALGDRTLTEELHRLREE